MKPFSGGGLVDELSRRGEDFQVAVKRVVPLLGSAGRVEVIRPNQVRRIKRVGHLATGQRDVVRGVPAQVDLVDREQALVLAERPGSVAVAEGHVARTIVVGIRGQAQAEEEIVIQVALHAKTQAIAPRIAVLAVGAGQVGAAAAPCSRRAWCRRAIHNADAGRRRT